MTARIRVEQLSGEHITETFRRACDSKKPEGCTGIQFDLVGKAVYYSMGTEEEEDDENV